ncbi:hypothetical protein [Mycolicibacterium moriokaense]|uniref:hypothetical protein n=1 Tax=Mycolicibacterium moriokaense TaxID=39691 RepID=UPI0011B7464C|nr:hypothetical protein [Mycolicibacterium moriokaense]
MGERTGAAAQLATAYDRRASFDHDIAELHAGGKLDRMEAVTDGVENLQVANNAVHHCLARQRLIAT